MIEMLPSAHGDGLFIEYGTAAHKHRVLVDGGTEPAYKTLKARIELLPAAQRHFELLVITHIDADHIGGIVQMLEKDELGVTFDDVWFNGFPHLDAPEAPLAEGVEMMGGVQGERLTQCLVGQGKHWNKAFGRGPVRVRDNGSLAVITLGGGMQMTVLGPTSSKLLKLKPKWEQECIAAGLDPLVALPQEEEEDDGVEPMGPVNIEALAATPFHQDTAAPNGSSISLLAEFEHKRVLLGADAHPDTLLGAIDRMAGHGQRLKLDAFKLPHHASKNNVSIDLLKRVTCNKYLVSTNGAQFKHPDREAIARVIKHGGNAVKLFFNYDTEFTAVWADQDLQNGNLPYAAEYGGPGGGLKVSL